MLTRLCTYNIILEKKITQNVHKHVNYAVKITEFALSKKLRQFSYKNFRGNENKFSRKGENEIVV
jgi:hypothetical protein